jgi:hypothetical protein
MSKVDHRLQAERDGLQGERQRRFTLLAQAAARILMDGEADDFGDAKRRAAEYLGVSTSRDLPDNQTVLAAIIEHQRLFDQAATVERTERLRTVALKAMQRLLAFDPRLVGPVLYGTPFEHTPITLHLFSDEVEAVSRQLLEWKSRFRLEAQSRRVGGRNVESYPVLVTSFNGEALDLVVMPLVRLAHPPFSPLDGAPYRRLAVPGLAALLDSQAAGELLQDLKTSGLFPP